MPVDETITGYFRDISILYALPLLLFSSDVPTWFKQSHKTIVGFACAAFSGMIAATIVSLYLSTNINDIWIPGGMMAGIHTGGTPNLFAVGLALGAEEEVFTLTNSAQILWGAIYLLFVLTLAQKLFGLFLKKADQNETEDSVDTSYLRHDLMNPKMTLLAIVLATVIVAFSVALSFLVYDKLESTLIIVLITTIAIMCSFNHKVRSLQGSFEVGDFCLLMFGVAVGMMSDFKSLIEDGGAYVLFVLLIFLITIILHIGLCRLCGVDRDTSIMTSSAAIYGPVFIPQVAQALKNKSLIVGGIAVSLLGLAAGNYIGIAIGYFIKYLLEG